MKFSQGYKVLKKEPRLVVVAGESVLKFFKGEEECSHEFNALVNSPLTSDQQLINEYVLSSHSASRQSQFHYSMPYYSGASLADSTNTFDYFMAGVALAKFHELSCKNNTSMLFGDFTSDHIIIDPASRSIALIDPGADFCRLGEPEVDVARFLIDHLKRDFYRIGFAAQSYGALLDGYYCLSNRKLDAGRVFDFASVRIRRERAKIRELLAHKRMYIALLRLVFCWCNLQYLKFRLRNIY